MKVFSWSHLRYFDEFYANGAAIAIAENVEEARDILVGRVFNLHREKYAAFFLSDKEFAEKYPKSMPRAMTKEQATERCFQEATSFSTRVLSCEPEEFGLPYCFFQEPTN